VYKRQVNSLEGVFIFNRTYNIHTKGFID